MVRFTEDLIEEIRTNNDIVDVISQYVTLKRSGRSYFGLCPFHKEKTPSFSVSVDKQIFHCFGCGAGGNVIHFIQKIENIDFKESKKINEFYDILKKNGIDVTVRRKFGNKISAACGQLRSKEV